MAAAQLAAQPVEELAAPPAPGPCAESASGIRGRKAKELDGQSERNAGTDPGPIRRVVDPSEIPEVHYELPAFLRRKK